MNKYDFFQVYDSNNKLRIGSTYDGGYIIIDKLCDYDVLLSCGIANDDTFEHYFVNKYNKECFAFDGTVNNIPHQHKKIIFMKKNIGITNDTTDMKYLIKNYDNIFLKMDIEGSEYDWINNLSDIEINKFKQICIEFHLEHECANNISLNNKLNAIKKLTISHYCVHFHGNNWRSTTLIGEKIINIGASVTNKKIIDLDKEYSTDTKVVFDYKSQFPINFSYIFDKNSLIITRTDQDSGWDHDYKCVIDGIQIPKVFECTYIHKSLVKELKLNTKNIPDILYDRPNTGNWRPPTEDFENNRKAKVIVPDIYINTYPFVSKYNMEDTNIINIKNPNPIDINANTSVTIPKIIHQTYKNHDLPETYKMCQTEIKRLHPDFEYRFYTDEYMDRLMKTDFPEYYEKFNELPRMIMKIDMFRYFLMYKYGGLYADMDYIMFKPFDLLSEKVVIPCNREDKNGIPICLGNCIFASVPNHPFWKSLMDTLFTIDRRKLPFHTLNDILESTGPSFVFAFYNKHLNKNDINVPKKMLFHPPTKKNDKQYIQELKKIGCYGMHLCTGVWLNNKL